MQRVFVLDNQKQPLSPCSSARARMLLRGERAAVYRRFPFAIILKNRSGGDVQPVELKLDPGSKTTGLALVAEVKRGKVAVFAVKLDPEQRPFSVVASGRGSRQMCRMDKYGFPRTGPKGARTVKGFKTGDLVQAVVPAGKKAGTHLGRVAVRSTGSFNVTTTSGTVQGISHKHCRRLHRADGYGYHHKPSA